MERLTMWDEGNKEILAVEEEKLLASKGFITNNEAIDIKKNLVTRLFEYEQLEAMNSVNGIYEGTDTTLKDKNGDSIHIGDCLRDHQENKTFEYQVIFATHELKIPGDPYPLSITGIWLVEDEDFFLPGVIDGKSAIESMEIVK